MTCGGEDLKQFVDKAGKNAHYTSKDAVVDFVEALGTWVDESLLARLQNARCQVYVVGLRMACLLSISSRSSH